MNLDVDVSPEELKLLVAHLQQHIQRLERDLVRTDNPTAQHSLARDVERLEQVCLRLERRMQPAPDLLR